MSYQEKPITKLYWSMSEVATELGISQDLLRRWCDTFNLKIVRGCHKNRRFTEADRILVREIYFLIKVEGMTIWGAKKKLEL